MGRISNRTAGEAAQQMITTERAAFDGEESERLMAELWQEIDQLYGNDAPSTWRLTGMQEPGAAFVIARRDGNAVGCAALRPRTSSIAEVKRMYVQPHARRAGVARAIMSALERIAREEGFSEIWLETGLRQPAAVRLYENLGYTRIAASGEHKGDPLSVSFAKPLQ